VHRGDARLQPRYPFVADIEATDVQSGPYSVVATALGTEVWFHDAVFSKLKNLPSVCASSAERINGRNGRSVAIGQMSPYLGQKLAHTTIHAPRQIEAASLERQVLSE
jgi:hypothetical protein